ncbi:MAG: hypothetical protein ABSB33_02405 [Tepidisphaeraceae bacterium]|jgi:hypothetical protein
MLTDDERNKAFLQELEREIAWQWKWEKRFRRFLFALNWATWFVRVLILAIAAFQVSWIQQGTPSVWIVFSLAVLSVLNIGIPMISTTFRHQQRQEIYDTHAREYSAIRIEFLTGQVDLATAVQMFTKVQRQPVEALIRKTP